MITAFCSGVPQKFRTPQSWAIFAIAFIVSSLAGCGGSGKPQVVSITFTTDPSGKVPVCTTAITAQTPANTPLCSATLPGPLKVGGQAAYVFANVVNDDQFLGVSWTVTCGSAPPVSSGQIDAACGTFSAAQTVSGPVPLYPVTGIVSTFNAPPAVPKGSTVTITAHVTSSPSITESLTLTIIPATNAAASAAPGQAGMHEALTGGSER